MWTKALRFLSFVLLTLAVGISQAESATLVLAAQSYRANWNAIAPLGDNSLFASAQRWTDPEGPQLTYIDSQGAERAWPNQSWNSWQPGQPAENAFVNINAMRLIGSQLWVVDTGTPEFGSSPLPGGAKLVAFDVPTGKVYRSYIFDSSIAGQSSYVDDVRINGQRAYLTDAGWPGLIVLDLATGQSRRVLSGHQSTTASDRPIEVEQKILLAPDGSALKVNADPIELSPDAQWLYYGPLNGPMYRVPTRLLDDETLAPGVLEQSVEVWFDMPPAGGTAMAQDGTFYYSDLAENALKRRLPDGKVETVVQDSRLHWVDALALDENNTIWLPVPQLDRVALFQNGRNLTQWPVQAFKLDLNAVCMSNISPSPC